MSSYFRNVYDGLVTALIGMKVTWKHLFTPAVTIQYPHVKPKLPERARNRLYVNIDDCIGCDQCAMACPVDCITIETIKSTPDVDLGLTSVGTKKRLYVPRFDIDIAKCCYCGLCVPPCPTECIKMTDVYEFSEFDRERLVYSFAVMTPAEADQAKVKLVAYDKEQPPQKPRLHPHLRQHLRRHLHLHLRRHLHRPLRLRLRPHLRRRQFLPSSQRRKSRLWKHSI
jgi:NADH-quinone oxidoreductase subunit I